MKWRVQLWMVTDSQTLPFQLMCAPSSNRRQDTAHESTYHPLSQTHVAASRHGVPSARCCLLQPGTLLTPEPETVLVGGHFVRVPRAHKTIQRGGRAVSLETGTASKAFGLSVFEASGWDRHLDAPGTVTLYWCLHPACTPATHIMATCIVRLETWKLFAWC